MLGLPSDDKWGNQEGFFLAVAGMVASLLFFIGRYSCLESRATASALGTPQNLAVVVRLVGGWILVWTHVRWMGTLHLGILSSGTWCQTVSFSLCNPDVWALFSPNWVPFFLLESSTGVFFSSPTYIWRGFWNQVALFIRLLLLLFSSL